MERTGQIEEGGQMVKQMAAAKAVHGMAITGDGETWRVHSASGHDYTVRYCGSGDGDPEYIAIWECDCPAARYRPNDLCKHIRAVIEFEDNL